MMYHDFKVDKKGFVEMIDTGDRLFRRQYIQMRTLITYLYLKSHERSYFNLLIIITLFYHMCIEYEIYTSAYKTRKCVLYDSQFLNGKMGKCVLRSLGH